MQNKIHRSFQNFGGDLKDGVGVGIFSMQGFERRNKESKNTLKRFCNHRGNIVVPNLKRLWDIFHNSKNAY